MATQTTAPAGEQAPRQDKRPDEQRPPKADGEQREKTKAQGQEGTQEHGKERAQQQKEPPALWRSLVAELFGTFALTFVAAGGEVIGAVSGGKVGEAAKAVAPGLLVMAVIYGIGDVSGAHINPAVTLAFAARGDFPWRRVPAYWLAQVIGATVAALALFGLFGAAKHVGATLPHHGAVTSLAMEFVLTCFLLTAILGTATRYSLVGPNAAVAVGGAIALCGLFAGPISGASMNPARSLGPAIVGGALGSVWLYVVGPCAAALAMVGLMNVLHPRPDAKEDEAAQGDGRNGKQT